MANRPVSVRGWYDLQTFGASPQDLFAVPYESVSSSVEWNKKKRKSVPFDKGVYGTMDLAAIKFIRFKLIMSSWVLKVEKEEDRDDDETVSTGQTILAMAVAAAIFYY